MDEDGLSRNVDTMLRYINASACYYVLPSREHGRVEVLHAALGRILGRERTKVQDEQTDLRACEQRIRVC